MLKHSFSMTSLPNHVSVQSKSEGPQVTTIQYCLFFRFAESSSSSEALGLSGWSFNTLSCDSLVVKQPLCLIMFYHLFLAFLLPLSQLFAFLSGHREKSANRLLYRPTLNNISDSGLRPGLDLKTRQDQTRGA